MLEFCAQEQCSLDSAGRLKLGADVVRDFQRHHEEQVILYCLPEGAIGVFPPDTWQEIRGEKQQAVDQFADNLVVRRNLRRFGASCHLTTITNQGRITIPASFREYAALEPGQQIMLVGNELGVELWNQARWQVELDVVNQHVRSKGDQQMTADIQPVGSRG